MTFGFVVGSKNFCKLFLCFLRSFFCGDALTRCQQEVQEWRERQYNSGNGERHQTDLHRVWSPKPSTSLVKKTASTYFCGPFWVSWEVVVLHGKDCIHWEAKSCTTTAYRWLCRDTHPSLRTLRSAVIKSPKFSARGTTLSVRLLHGALVILVLKPISQFLSSGKWVKMVCLLGTTFARGSKGNSWEELEASRFSGTLSSTSPCLNSCSHSGTPCNSSLCDSSSSYLFGFSISADPCNQCWWFLARTFPSCCWNFRSLRWRCRRIRWSRGTRW